MKSDIAKIYAPQSKPHTLCFTRDTAVSGGASRVEIGSSRTLFTYGKKKKNKNIFLILFLVF